MPLILPEWLNYVVLVIIALANAGVFKKVFDALGNIRAKQRDDKTALMELIADQATELSSLKMTVSKMSVDRMALVHQIEILQMNQKRLEEENLRKDIRIKELENEIARLRKMYEEK